MTKKNIIVALIMTDNVFASVFNELSLNQKIYLALRKSIFDLYFDKWFSDL